jgi:hypothetical protein
MSYDWRRRSVGAIPPRMLRAHNQDVAIMMPVADTKRSKRKRVKTDTDYQAFLDGAGS